MKLEVSFAKDNRSLRPPWLAAPNQRQVATQNEDSERYGHEQRTPPEAPVAVHPMPVGAGILFTMVATVSFVKVPVSCHNTSDCNVVFRKIAVGKSSPPTVATPQRHYGFGVAAALTWTGRSASEVDELTAGTGLSTGISVPAG